MSEQLLIHLNLIVLQNLHQLCPDTRLHLTLDLSIGQRLLLLVDLELEPIVPIDGAPLEALLFGLHVYRREKLIQVILYHLVECNGRDDFSLPVHYQRHENREEGDGNEHMGYVC